MNPEVFNWVFLNKNRADFLQQQKILPDLKKETSQTVKLETEIRKSEVSSNQTKGFPHGHGLLKDLAWKSEMAKIYV